MNCYFYIYISYSSLSKLHRWYLYIDCTYFDPAVANSYWIQDPYECNCITKLTIMISNSFLIGKGLLPKFQILPYGYSQSVWVFILNFWIRIAIYSQYLKKTTEIMIKRLKTTYLVLAIFLWNGTGFCARHILSGGTFHWIWST